MIVGEPSLMGGEMDDEDERYITRLENTQYDPTTAPSTHYMSPGFQSQQQQQQNPNLQSLLHQKQQFIPNSPLIHQSQVKREQISFPGSPQQQQQQLPSMFSTGGGGGPPTPNANTNSNIFPPSSTPVNGDSSTGGKRISNISGSGNTLTTINNSSNSPPTPTSTNHNQVQFNSYFFSSNNRDRGMNLENFRTILASVLIGFFCV
jgi:LIM domain-binding protein 1